MLNKIIQFKTYTHVLVVLLRMGGPTTWLNGKLDISHKHIEYGALKKVLQFYRIFTSLAKHIITEY